MTESIHDAFERDARIHKAPVTQAEKELRERQRSRPVFTCDLHPDGFTQQEVNTRIESENERRIDFINKRLQQMKSKMKPDFERHLRGF